MSDIALATDGDLDTTGGDFRVISNLDAKRQHVEVRLRTFLGEWFLDTTVGVPYIQTVFAQKNPDVLSIQSVIRREILKTPGVLSITEMTVELDRAARTFNIQTDMLTEDGETTITLTAGV